MEEATAATQPLVTQNDFSSIPIVISWLAAVVVVLCVAAKLAMKLNMVRKLALDDSCILLSLVTWWQELEIAKDEVIGHIVAELYFRRASSRAADRTLAAWRVAVAAECVQCVSIVFACVPYLKQFFLSLESGMIRVDDARRRERTSSTWRRGARSRTPDRSKGSTLESRELAELQPAAGSWAGVNVSSARGGLEDGDADSIRSTARIIRATRTFEVHRENVKDGDSGA
ncbi:hypothetical protein UVI_02052030 [Ustilaginoidea virens]|uniref:Integral membrane protein n=1 Tax=Ustilaginoidea virens TaxID=1159556 RepID=A0A1B5L4R2_USTVR|nr:hypothetical protein UVI_02052030 [Ustilaginoidea virens]